MTKIKEIRYGEFLKTVFNIALPITVQNLLLSFSGILDSWMVAVLGDNAVAGVGGISRFLFVFNFTIYGINAGACGYFSQYWGKQDRSNLRKTLGICLILNVTIAFLFMIVSILFSDVIARSITNSEASFVFAKDFLLVITFGYVFMALAYTYSSILRSVEKAYLVSAVSIFAVFLNAALNFLLITGRFGFPYMGVKGAALATVISKAVEVSLIIFFVYFMDYPVAAKATEMFNFSKELFKKIAKACLTSGLNELIWSIGLFTWYMMMAKFSTNEDLGALGIISSIEQCFIFLFLGLSNASLVIIAKELAKKKNELAYRYAKIFMIGVPLLAELVGLTVFMLPLQKIFSYFYINISAAVIAKMALYLRIYCCFLFIRIFNVVTVGGILRSSSDVNFLFMAESGSIWLIGIPITILAGYFGFSGAVIYGLKYVEEACKSLFILKRILSKKWQRDLTE